MPLFTSNPFDQDVGKFSWMQITELACLVLARQLANELCVMLDCLPFRFSSALLRNTTLCETALNENTAIRAIYGLDAVSIEGYARLSG